MSCFTKKELRARYISLRKKIPADRKLSADQKICNRLFALQEVIDSQNVLVYAPFRNEIDLVPFFEKLYNSDKRTFFPKCNQNREMDFFLSSYYSLVPQAYGIKEPICLSTPFAETGSDVCILPCLAVTRDGFRLGYGGGYYDLFLSDHKVIKVAAVYSDFVLPPDSFQYDSFDIPADIIITEEEVIRL